MSNKTIFKIAFVPIWLLFILFAIQYIFGLISEPDSIKVAIGVVLLSCLILITLLIFKKIYFNHE
ncbi:hypothetical protein EAH69_05950 [Faecalibacter macacae]|uniref:Uncharacterized protein n=1 Tax=Faecalibacter macacae TaxID=1859289 RepID=A0A3L9MCB1_9FLAO|nr:hypothetical protein EAH69_05950 [Faecalibacter macacae]